MNGSEENAQDSLRNVNKLGLRSARKLARAGIKVSLIELRGCEFLRKLARPGFKWAEFEMTQ